MLRKERNKKRYRRPWKKLFALMSAFVMTLSVFGGASLDARELTGAEKAWRRIMKQVANPQCTDFVIAVDKLIEGREVREDDLFTFSIEPSNKVAEEICKTGMFDYETTFQVGPSVQPCDTFVKEYVEKLIDEGLEEAKKEGLEVEERIVDITRQILMTRERSRVEWYANKVGSEYEAKGNLGFTIIRLFRLPAPQFYGVSDEDCTFRIKEVGSNGELVDSKAEWELSIPLIGRGLNFNRLFDDAGNDDGKTSGLIGRIYESSTYEAVLSAASFTNTKLKGEVLLQPADMTIYMGGSEGYEGVVNNETNGTIESANSLPEAGYYLTLPEEADAMMKEAWRNSGDITEVTNADGTAGYVLNLSDYVRIKDTEDGREWTLEMYGSGYSMAYNKYIYRLVPVDAAEPVRLQFTDPKGNTVTEDTFAIEDALYEEYTMEVYPQSVHAGNVVAEVKLSETKTLTFPVALEEGKLKVRYVSGEQSEVVHEAVEDIEQVVGEGGKLSDAAAVVKPGTKFYINDSQIPVGEDAKPSLLFDDLVTNEDAAGTDYEALLREAALEKTTAEYKDPRHEAKYLDLVDANNGNVWLQASEAVTVYWPYPEGTDEDTGFTLIHFKGLDREMGTEEAGELIAQAKTEEIAVQKDERGIYFETKGFSPFVLLWEAEETEEPIVPSEPEETKKPSSSENDAIETGIASEGRIYGGMTASAALLAAIVYVLKKRQTPASK